MVAYGISGHNCSADDLELAGIIPDDAPFDSEGEASTLQTCSSSQSSAQQYHLTKWDQYFDVARDLHLQHRHGIFRWACDPLSAGLM